MAAARRAAMERGWADTLIHSEAFQPIAAPAGAEEGETFSVTLASSGEQWPVPPHKTIAQVLGKTASPSRSPARWGFTAPV